MRRLVLVLALVACAACSRGQPLQQAPDGGAATQVDASRVVVVVVADAGPGLDRGAALRALNDGRARAKSEDWEGALADLDRALAITPNDPRVLSELGWAAFQANQLARADDANRRALAAANDPRIRASILYNIGRVAEARGDRAAALKAYRDSLALRENADVRRRFAGLATPAPTEEEHPECTASFADVSALCRCFAEHEQEQEKPCRLEGTKPLGDGRLAVVRYGGEELGETSHLLVARENARFRVVADLGHDFEPGAFGVHNSARVNGGMRRNVGGHTVVVVSSTQSDNDFNMAGLELCRYEARLETVCALDDEHTTCTPPLPVDVDGGCGPGMALDSKDIDADAKATLVEIARNATHYHVKAAWNLDDGVVTLRIAEGARDRLASEALAPHALW